MTTKKNKKRRQRSFLTAVIVLALIAAGVIGVLLFRGKYARAGGETVALDAAELDLRGTNPDSLTDLERCTALKKLDLRGNELSVEQVTALAEKLPDCEIRWDIPLGELRFDSALEELVLEEPGADWRNLLLFPGLKKLSFNRCTDGEAAAVLREQGIELHYNVPVSDRLVASDTSVLTLRGGETDAGTLGSALAMLPKLRTVRIEECGFSAEEKHTLRQSFPAVTFIWENTVGSRRVQSTACELKLAPGEATATQLRELLPLFPLLRDVDISECGYSLEEIRGLCEALPELHFIWSYELLGKTVSSDDREADLSKIPMSDTAAVEAALPWLPNLEKVIMSDCGFSDEQMDALNQKYEDVRFVWTVYFGTFSLRTDAKAFIAAKYDNWVMLKDSDIRCFRYCTDLEAQDLGHMAITDLSFVQYMPHLKYLVVVEAPISDITPLAQCAELKYLEIFKCPVVDLEPLLSVKTMEDLNICYIWIPTELAFDQLSQMTWLDRLWYCGTWFTDAQKAELQSLLPDCEMDLRWGAESTGGTWRKHEHYYEMRDAFDMYYMPGGTNGLNENGEWVVNPG
ncbi:MAG: hypothetical protein KBS46_05535 [Clostridiales bacterium]|nr:hypothetical protein [Candidatus Apopatocola equi]